MSRNYIRKYQAGDLDLIVPHDAYVDDPTVKDRGAALCGYAEGLTVTILDPDGIPMAVMGGILIYSKVMEIWAVVDVRVKMYPKHFMKYARKVMQDMFNFYSLNRIQGFVRSDMPWAFRAATFMGFNLEGQLACYGEENKPHYLFAKVRR